jgi:hypothetical protein
LRQKPSGFDKLDVVVSTGSHVLVVHESFKSDDPRPFFVCISAAEVELIILGSDLKACRNHFLIFTEIAFIGFDFLQVNNVGDLFAGFVRKSEEVIHGQNDPSFAPFFQEFRSLVQWPFSDLAVL